MSYSAVVRQAVVMNPDIDGDGVFAMLGIILSSKKYLGDDEYIINVNEAINKYREIYEPMISREEKTIK